MMIPINSNDTKNIDKDKNNNFNNMIISIINNI